MARQVVDNLPLGVYRSTLDGHLVSANPAMLTLFGLPSPDRAAGHSTTVFYEDPQDRVRLLERLQREGRVRGFRVRLRRPDGTAFWAEIHASLAHHGEATMFIDGIVEDITRLVEAEEERNLALMSLQNLIDHTPAVGIQVYDAEGRVQLWNAASEALYGYTDAEMTGRRLQDVLLSGDEVRQFEAEVARILATGQPVPPREWTIHTKDGGFRHVFSTMFPLPHVRGGIAICCMDVDITERKRGEEELRQSEARYRLMAENSSDLVARHALDGTYVYASPSTRALLGYAPEELVGRRTDEFVAAEDLPVLQAARLAVLQGPATQTIAYRARRRDGAYVWFEATLRSVRDPATDEPLEIISASRDISQRKAVEEQVAYHAYHDVLTGLPNRTLFNDRLTLALAQAVRSKRPVAVVFLDLDHFKRINDTLGHTMGDHLLRCVAVRVTECLREGDTVARVGGDEFTLILQGIHDATDAAKVAQKLLDVITRPFVIEGHQFFVTASVGIAVFPHDGRDGETLLKNADNAMYRAKEMGRNTYQLCTAAMTARAVERLALENELRAALNRGEFEVRYQGVHEAVTRRLVGAEALVRWRHPSGRLVEPGAFVKVAEEARLILPLGEWVLREACRQARAWQDKGAGLRVSVNLSPLQFQQPNLLDVVQAALSVSGCDPRRLELEITETTAMANVDATIEALRALRALGIRVALDDFGSGHSSLNHLKRLPLDAVKIDQAFVRDVTELPRDASIVAAIVSMAHSLGLRVVAEGVET
ncbi:MAG TPA: EAL domain-containing protein, partial [Vicinamibacteria bacterium]|nr:EAL domain-containing protein [Vicinamibacteria bacterium]